MITIFFRQDGRICERELRTDEVVPDEPVWIDLITPTDVELRQLPQNLNIALPNRDEIWRNHALNRMYTRDGTSYMTAALLAGLDHPDLVTITYVLTPDFLITIRDRDTPAFLAVQERLLLRPARFPTSADVLEALVEDEISALAHYNDTVMRGLDTLSSQVFGDEAVHDQRLNPSLLMRGVMKTNGQWARANSNINESLHSLERLLTYFMESHNRSDPRLNRDGALLLGDARSLSEQTAFLSSKIGFLQDAALGMINVEQNLVMKIFSVMTVFLVPPTLIAGIYGMNFREMPELNWSVGYPMAICLMGLSAVVPYLYFRRKGLL